MTGNDPVVDPTQVLVALIAVSGVVFTGWTNRKQAKAAAADKEAREQEKAEARRKQQELERRKLDGDVYERERQASIRTIEALQKEVERERQLREEDRAAAQRELGTLHRQVEALRLDLSTEQRENVRLREHIDMLERTIVRLRAKLVEDGRLDERRPPRGTAEDRGTRED